MHQRTKNVMPRYSNTCFTVEKRQLETKERHTAVDEVGTDRLLAQQRGQVVLDDPIPLQK
jgi:hypothetical protein